MAGKPGIAPNPAADSSEPDPVPPTYTVKRGDTLHVIALEHGLDYRELAQWNNIENINVIRVGQVLRLSAPGDASVGAGVVTTPLRAVPAVVPSVAGTASPTVAPVSAAAGGDAKPAAPHVITSRNSENYKSQPKTIKEPYSEHALREMQQRANIPAIAAVPATGSSGGSMSAASVAAASPAATASVTAAPGASASVATVGTPAGTGTEAASAPTTVARADPKLESKAEPRSGTSSVAEGDDEKVDWVWPAKGKLVTGFSDTANLKGIDIAGKSGQPVLASASGKVVYAGTGLRGYGKLIIIKHSKSFLSAYAHNKDILVKEGQQVARGQKIAEMGSSDSDQVKLHFEIRRLGKPTDPLKYLPPA